MKRYSYNGPVMEFERCVDSRWCGETVAPTEKKAKSNLAFQWKKLNNRTAACKITLPGKLDVIEQGG